MCHESPQALKRRRFANMREVAEELGISERSAWRLVGQGELPSHQFGNSTRIKREDLDAYIDRSRRRNRRTDHDEPGDEEDS
jgi:excisionase family DNA binding protein